MFENSEVAVDVVAGQADLHRVRLRSTQQKRQAKDFKYATTAHVNIRLIPKVSRE
jgi:hypothetical protein